MPMCAIFMNLSKNYEKVVHVHNHRFFWKRREAIYSD